MFSLPSQYGIRTKTAWPHCGLPLAADRFPSSRSTQIGFPIRACAIAALSRAGLEGSRSIKMRLRSRIIRSAVGWMTNTNVRRI